MSEKLSRTSPTSPSFLAGLENSILPIISDDSYPTVWPIFLVQKSVSWTFDTVVLPTAQTLMRIAV